MGRLRCSLVAAVFLGAVGTVVPFTRAASYSSCTRKPQGCQAIGTAQYEVTFEGDWVTPRPPQGAAFSPLVGMSHGDCASLWSAGGYATAGLREVADTGATATIRSEITALGQHSLSTLESPALDQVEIGSVVTNFTVDAYHPLVSVLSKAMPSPDWFVGVYDLSLCTASDEWIGSTSVDVVMWDAGTDSGLNFTSERNVTMTQQPIAMLSTESNRTAVFMGASNPRIGRLTFRRIALYEDQPATNPNCHTCDRSGDRSGAHACGCEEVCRAGGQAVYFVKLSTNWVDPAPPADGLFSPLTVASHTQCSVLWRNLVYATQGVQTVSETGNRTFLMSELTALGNHVGNILALDHISTTGSVSGLVRVDRFHPVVSLVSMLAPSPDWFVGLDSAPMCTSLGWLQSATYRLLPWDAGTDHGLTFPAADSPSLPHGTVTRIRGSTEPQGSVFHGRGDTVFATVTFERVDVLADPLISSVTDTFCPACNSSVTCVRSYDVTTNNTLVSSSTISRCPASSDGFVSESNLIAYCFIAGLIGIALGAIFLLLLVYCKARRSNSNAKYKMARNASSTSSHDAPANNKEPKTFQPMMF